MPKSDIRIVIDTPPNVRNGEITGAATVVQVSQLAMSSPFSGDFQIVDNGRLIVGENIDFGDRVVVGKFGLFGYDPSGVNTFAVLSKQHGQFGAGDVFAGYAAGNHLLFRQADGTLGLYSPAGAGFIASADGSLWAGDTDGAHMHWSQTRRALEVRNGEDIKISLDANGDAVFDGTVYASGGRIYGAMQVDGLLRAGDVDGPSVSLGRFERDDGNGNLIESGEIIATDASNMPWFHVTAGGGLPGGGWFHLGGSGDYPQRLTYDGADLVFDGILRAQGGEFVGDVAITTGSLTTESVVISATGIRIDANYGKFGENAVEWWTNGARYLSIGSNNLELPIGAYVESLGALTIAAPTIRLAGSVAFLGQMAVPVVAAINATNQSLYEDSADNHLYYKNSLGASYKLS